MEWTANATGGIPPVWADQHSAESITHPADGLDSISSDLLSQIANIDIDDVAAGVIVITPHR